MDDGCKAFTPLVGALVKEVRGLLKGDEFYPYLATESLAVRQVVVASMLARTRPRRILDVGFYWRPIYRYIHSFCPDEIVGLEPVADPVSVAVPCPPGTRTSGGREVMMVHTLSMGIQQFNELGGMQPAVEWGEFPGRPAAGPMAFDSVVCLGCEGDFVQAADLEAYSRPFSLAVEWPPQFPPSVDSFSKLSGTEVFESVISAIGVRESTKFFDRRVRLFAYT